MEHEHGVAFASGRQPGAASAPTSAGIQVEPSARGRVAIAAAMMALGVVAVLAMVDLRPR